MLSRRSLGLGALALGTCVAGGLPAQARAPFAIKLLGPARNYFKGSPKIAITSYQINFIAAKQATAVGGIGARTRLAAVLAGVDEATARRLTDAAHADLRAQLEAAGIGVASDAEAQAIVAGVPQLPGNKEDVPIAGGITIGNSVKQGWVTLGATAAPALKPFQNMRSPNGMSAPGAGGGMNKDVGKRLDAADTAMLNPSLTLDFVNLEAKSGSGLTGMFASTGGKLQFAVTAGSPVTLYTCTNVLGIGTPAGWRPDKHYTVDTPFASVATGAANVRPLGGLGDARGDLAVVDLPAWEALVRDGYQSYNAAIVKGVQMGQG